MFRGQPRVTKATKHLAEEKGWIVVPTPGGPPRMAVISESGLCKLIMRSHKPAARRFQDWVTREVLLVIPRTSYYADTGCSPRPAVGVRSFRRATA